MQEILIRLSELLEARKTADPTTSYVAKTLQQRHGQHS